MDRMTTLHNSGLYLSKKALRLVPEGFTGIRDYLT